MFVFYTLLVSYLSTVLFIEVNDDNEVSFKHCSRFNPHSQVCNIFATLTVKRFEGSVLNKFIKIKH